VSSLEDAKDATTQAAEFFSRCGENELASRILERMRHYAELAEVLSEESDLQLTGEDGVLPAGAEEEGAKPLFDEKP